MIVTEEEAKTKRCQESFAACNSMSTDGAGYMSSWSHPPPPASPGGTGAIVHTAPLYCLGSACMAWRWVLEHEHGDPYNQLVKTDRGFCGKAGGP